MSADCTKLVRAAWSVEGPAKEAVLPGFVAPDCHVEFVFHLGECWSSRHLGTGDWSSQPRAFIHAGDRGCLEFSGTGNVSTLAVRVSPVTATRLLGRGIADIWNQTLPLSDFAGSEADELIEALRRSVPGARYQIVDRWIRARLHSWHAADAEVERLFFTLLWKSHSDTIAEVARALGPSERSLRRTLAHHAGLAPKDVQLTGRLLTACALLREDARLSITDIAARTGFYDHAAFAHAFRTRLGLTPNSFVASRMSSTNVHLCPVFTSHRLRDPVALRPIIRPRSRSMLRPACISLSIFLTAAVYAAEPVAGLREMQWLIGDWRGLGEGDPGRSAVERHAELALGGHFVRVEGRSVYPKQEKNPKGDIHGEIDLWSYDRARQTVILRQFDTLGFVGTYALDKASSSTTKWVLVGESLENVPKGWKARYTFTLVAPDEYHEMLELDADGKGFKAYVTNRFLRVEK